MYLPEPTGTKTPVCFKIPLDSDLLIPRSAFIVFPLEACFDSPGGTRHRWAPRRQPMPREERWDGQMVQDERKRGRFVWPHFAIVLNEQNATRSECYLWLCAVCFEASPRVQLIWVLPFLIKKASYMCRPPLNRGVKILFFRLSRSLSVDVLFWFALFLAFLGSRVTKPF